MGLYVGRVKKEVYYDVTVEAESVEEARYKIENNIDIEDSEEISNEEFILDIEEDD